MSERPEFTKTGWETTNIVEIPLPADPTDIDDEWCSHFNAVYGFCQMKTMLHVRKFRREILDNQDFPDSGSKSYESKQFVFKEDDDLDYRPVIGTVSRMVLLPDFGRPGQYHPHLGLKDVVSAGENVQIAHDPRQEFLIPIEAPTDDEEEPTLILFS